MAVTMAPKFVASIGRSCSLSNCTKRDICVPLRLRAFTYMLAVAIVAVARPNAR